jgi:hypothetical protein
MGLFGESTEELAKREIESRKKYASKNVGVPIKQSIDEIKAQDNNAKIIKTNKNIVLITFSVFALFFIVVLGSIIYTNLTRPDADYEGFAFEMKAFMDTNKDIYDIEIDDNNMFSVIVYDTWYNSSEKDKLRFCQSVREKIYIAAFNNKLIYRDRDNVFVYFYDTTKIGLAEPTLSGFKILH